MKIGVINCEEVIGGRQENQPVMALKNDELQLLSKVKNNQEWLEGSIR
jgi:hypothetical protein